MPEPEWNPGNSTTRMLELLRQTYPDVDPNKLVTLEQDARHVNASLVTEAPRVCFIDGEHARSAVVSDFGFCERVAARDAVLVFHDANLVWQGLVEIHWRLRRRGVPGLGFALGTSVYVLLRGTTRERFEHELLRWARPADRGYWLKVCREFVRLRLQYWRRVTIRRLTRRRPRSG